MGSGPISRATAGVLVVVIGGLLWWLYQLPNRTDLATFWALVVAVIALGVALLQLVSNPASAQDGAARTLGRFAERLREESRYATRDLLTAPLLQLHWHPHETAGNAHVATTSRRHRPVPGFPAVSAGDLADGEVLPRQDHGEVLTLDEVFGGLASGKLAVIGPRGAGKSAAAALIAGELLQRRAAAGVAEERKPPVPVLMHASAWDFSAHADDVVIAHLMFRYPNDFGGARGGRTARRLVLGDSIAVLVDGLDEVAPDRQAAILRALCGSSFRWAVFSRSDDPARLVKAVPDVLVLELEAVRRADLHIYLGAEPDRRPTTRWARLSEAVDTERGALRDVLRRPSMLSLMRATQDEKGIAELVSMAWQKRSEREVEEHLLLYAVKHAYTSAPGEQAPTWSVSEATTALGRITTLAERSVGAQDVNNPRFSLWDIPRWTSVAPRAIVVGALGALSVWSGYVLISLEQPTLTDLVGLDVALLAGLGCAVGAWRVRAGSALDWWRPSSRATGSLPVGIGLALGFLAQFATGARLGPIPLLVLGGAGTVWVFALAWLRASARTHAERPLPAIVEQSSVRLVTAAFVGVILATTASVVFPSVLEVGVWGSALLTLTLGLWFGAPRADERVDAATPPREVWSAHRRWTLISWFLLGLPCGILVTLPPAQIANTPITLGFPLVAGLMLGNLFPVTWTTTLATLQLRLAHGLPHRLIAFLEDAHTRGVLRSDGSVYTFRHAALARYVVEARNRSRAQTTSDTGASSATSGSSEPRESADKLPASLTLVVGLLVRVGAVLLVAVLAWLGFGVLYPSLWLSRFAILLAAGCGVGAALGSCYQWRRSRSSIAKPLQGTGLWTALLVPAAFGYLAAFDVGPAAGPLAVTLAWGLTGGVVTWLFVGMVRRFAGGVPSPGTATAWAWLPGPAPVFGLGIGYVVAAELALYHADRTIYAVEFLVSVVLVVSGLAVVLRGQSSSRASMTRRGMLRRCATVLLLSGLVVGFLGRSTIRFFGAVVELHDPELVPTATTVAVVLSTLAGFAVVMIVALRASPKRPHLADPTASS